LPRTLIAIVNYRTAGQTCACLESLAAEGPQANDFKVVVIDNGSADGSDAAIAECIRVNGWQEWAQLVVGGSNSGFAAGNNAILLPALKQAEPPEFFLLLNPDTIVRPGAIASLVRFLEDHPRAGIAGSRLEDPDGTPQRSAFRFPGILSEFERAMRLGLCTRLLAKHLVAPPVRADAHRIDWLAGASMLVRRQVLEQIGVLDDRFFLYYEELDFCLRAVRVGWECWYVPTSRVVHLVGQATGLKSGQAKGKRTPRYWFESRRRYFEKSHGWFYARLTDISWLCGHLLWRMRRFVQRKPDDDPPHLLWDFCTLSLLPRRGNA
jgi:N-acetylglucosaminyl-diphospho-decaprenol L-rhamnosyltransferase